MQQLPKQTSESQSQGRGSKAMVCLALSMGATSAILPDQVVAQSLLTSSNNEQSLRLDKQPKGISKIDLNKDKEKLLKKAEQPITLEKKAKEISAPKLVKANKPKTVTTSTNLLSNQIIHTVKRGDTINEIAASYKVNPLDLIEVNQLANPEVIEVNQRLIIPKPPKSSARENGSVSSVQTPSPNISKLRAEVMRLRQEYDRQKSQPDNSLQLAIGSKAVSTQTPTMAPSLVRLKEDVTQLRKQYEAGQKSEPKVILASSTVSESTASEELEIVARQPNIPELPPLLPPEEYLPETPIEVFDGYIWPAKGVFTSGYGWRRGRMHKGIDIAAPIGTPIYAAAGGEVIYAGWNAYGFGNLVKIRHGDGSVTLYAHNNRILVRKGDRVEQGQQISEMGSTGRSTGPHLHFEIHTGGQGAVNPIAYLPSR